MPAGHKRGTVAIGEDGTAADAAAPDGRAAGAGAACTPPFWMGVGAGAELAMPGAGGGGGAHEVGDDRGAVGGEDRLRVELDAFDRAGGVADGHGDAVGTRRDEQAGG